MFWVSDGLYASSLQTKSMKTLWLLFLLAGTASAGCPRYVFENPLLNDEHDNICHEIDSVLKGDVRISSVSVTNMIVSTMTTSGITFASLGTSPNGTLRYCSDCVVTTPAICTTNALASCVCAGSGTGAFAKRVNGTWYCD